MPVIIGTSGWQYRHWRGRLYPQDVPQRAWLAHYAERFAAVEVNATFYRLPARQAVEAWARTAPADFVFAVKVSRYLTHVRRLREPAEPVARFMNAIEPLGDRLGPVLLQLPPRMACDADALEAVLRRFPAGVRVAVEPRDPSWFVPSVRRVLERRAAALCLADRSGLVTPEWRTAEWGYVRFHEGRAAPGPATGAPPSGPGRGGWRTGTRRGMTSSPSSTTTPRAAPRATPAGSRPGSPPRGSRRPGFRGRGRPPSAATHRSPRVGTRAAGNRGSR